MRFLELYFPAFGPFTDVGIQLSGGDRGLHVIYGPNEAGKSSTMRAIRGLLFGIPLRSQDDFVHESRKLLVGAKVRCEDGSDFVFLRRKGRKDTVLDLDRKPIPDAEVADLLGGMNEATYRQLFGIDHDDLIAGGREILSGGGEIGEALFSAALGGHGLRALVRDLETEAAELYVPRGKKKRVNVSLAEFKEIRAQLRDSTLSFAEWETKHSELSSSRERVQDLERQVSRSRAEKQRVESDARAIVHAKALERVRCELAEFGDFPRLRESFSGELHDALLSRERAHQGGVKLTERLKRVDRDLESVVVDSDVLAQGQLVDSFYQRLGVVLKDRDELSELERELALSRDSTERRELEVRAELDATRASSDGDSPDGLRIEPGEEIRLRELADQLVRHDARLEELSTELGDLEGEYEKRSRDLEEHEAVDDPAPLRAVVQSLSSEFFDEVDRAQVEAVERRERAEAAFRRVTMWSESAEDLEAKKFPLAETVERFEARFSENERRSDQVAAELARLSTRRGESEAQLRELEADGGELPSEDSLATRRERRDELWRDIRGQLRKPQEGWEVSREDHFERESRLADEVSDRLRREADRVSSANASKQALRKMDGEAEDLERETESISDARATIEAEWCAEWGSLKTKPRSPREMLSWLRSLDEFRGRAEEASSAAARASEGLARRDRVDEELRALLVRASDSDMPRDPRALFSLGRSVLAEREAQRAESIERTRECASARERRDRAAMKWARAKQRIDALKGEWRTALAENGLAESTTPKRLGALLSSISELVTGVRRSREIESRIARLAETRERFEVDVRGFTDRLDSAPDGDVTVEEAVGALQERLKAARAHEVERGSLERRLRETTVEIEELEGAVVAAEATLLQLREEARCETTEELTEVEKSWARVRRLDAQAGELEAKLADEAVGEDLSEFVARLLKLEPQGLREHLAALDEKIDRLDEERSEASRETGRLEAELSSMEGRGGAWNAAERAQGCLSRLRTEVEAYARSRISWRILQREMDRFRQENQGPMLERGSELFQRLTRERYEGLAIGFDASDRPCIEAVRSGAGVAVEALSDGTRDQLFFSLRVAALEGYLATRDPLPLIVDDLVIQFDDDRAAATLEVLAELSQKTQVIFLTHHRHLIPLARGVVDTEVLQVPSFMGLEEFSEKITN